MPSMTITYPAGDGTRFASALGKTLNLVDAQGLPRPANAAECKACLIEHARSIINNIEGGALAQAALATVVVPAVDMT